MNSQQKEQDKEAKCGSTAVEVEVEVISTRHMRQVNELTAARKGTWAPTLFVWQGRYRPNVRPPEAGYDGYAGGKLARSPLSAREESGWKDGCEASYDNERLLIRSCA